jgi:hypothetical protein
MSLLRLFNVQGLAGLAVSIALGILLVVQKGDTRHWQKQTGRFEKLYTQEQAALAGTVANYRAAADQARASDEANAARVVADQRAISERISNDYEARLASARSLARRLRSQSAIAAADPGSGGVAAMPGLPAAARGPAETAGQDRFPLAERELATEQAIQLDELIKWVRRQAALDPSAPR